jgi:hypothetical protein
MAMANVRDPHRPNLIINSRSLDRDLYRVADRYMLDTDGRRAAFIAEMAVEWRTTWFSDLTVAAHELDVEVGIHTTHDQLVQAVALAWLKKLIKHREHKPPFEIGDKVQFKNMLDRSGVTITVIDVAAKEVRIRETHTRWVTADSIEKVED